METSLAPKSTPAEHSVKHKTAGQTFTSAALDMSWRLAVAVLAPLLLGVQLDKWFNTSPLFTLIGLVLAFAGSGVVMWRAMQAANQLPVPKLSAAQKRAIQKQYEEDDD